MRLESPYYSAPINSRRYRWLQLLLVGGFALCTLISIFALVALWWLFGTTPAARTSELLAVESTQVRPELALMQLAGDPVDALVHQAFQAAEYETTQALVTFGVDLMPTPRIALILQLAQRLQQQEQRAQAVQLYRKGRAIAILDTTLTPLEKADALLQCANGFLALDQEREAIDSAYQVKQIAEQTPELLPAVRARLLQELQPLSAKLSDDLLRQQIRELSRSPYLSPTGIVIQEQLPFAEGSLEFDAQLSEIIHNRQLVSRQLAEQLLQDPSANTQPLVSNLAQALRLEDEQRALYFNQISSSQNLTFSLQFWTLAEQRQWLITKLAIAHRAYGLSLVPEWETQQPELTTELTLVTDNLQTILLGLAQSQPEPLAQLTQRIAILRWLALQTELGFYEQRATDVDERLRVAQNELALMGTNAALPVSYHLEATSPGYRIDR
ncbi:MAG: hypothetical protein R2932_08225 [Caldilineaceae bacterium]